MSAGSGGSSNVSCRSPTQVHSMRVPTSTNRGIKVSRPRWPIVMCMLRGLGSLLCTTCDWLRVVYRCCCPQRAKVGLQHNDGESVADLSERRSQGRGMAVKAPTETSHGCHPGCPQLIRVYLAYETGSCCHHQNRDLGDVFTISAIFPALSGPC
jgi:hypothetical protein